MAVAPGSVLVFGGRGFVGAAVCREVARKGFPVAILSRSSRTGAGGALGTSVQQLSGIDALKPETYEHLLPGARAIVISIGEAPWAERTGGSKERAIMMNGETNVAALQAAARAKVPRVVLVNATMPQWSLVAGYREGKEMAEAEARRYPEAAGLGADKSAALILKPGVISGTKYWGSVPIPFGLAFAPMRFVMRLCSGPCSWLERAVPSLFAGVLRPAVYVKEMAQASADFIAADAGSGVRVLGTDELVGYTTTSA